jgi:arginase family enzyme
VFDPLQRWRELGLPDKPDYAGLLTFAGLPTTQDAAELDGVDVAILGAPMDDLTSDRPGTRFGPRAIRAAALGASTRAPRRAGSSIPRLPGA